jgi:protein-S-isoprenylcysteine O-methyltransferase Ste14
MSFLYNKFIWLTAIFGRRNQIKMGAQTKDHPGVYIPPPLLYAAIFMLGIFLQHVFTINNYFFRLRNTKFAGILFLIAASFFIFMSIGQFIRTKNTVMTIRPANTLQTTGIYTITRNPMYQGLVFVYIGLTCIAGNWWNLILLPLLLFVVQQYVIRREESYLTREFGSIYSEYKARVRRWL